MDSDKVLYEKFQQILKNATSDEKQVMKLLVDGIERKQKGEYTTYITSLMQTRSVVGDEELIMTIPITPFLDNSVDIVHGGFTATLADTAMGTLINRKIPEHLVAVTTEMKINYISPGVGSELRCEARILHLGTRTSVTEGKIYNDQGTLVAATTGSFFLIERNVK